MRKDMIFQQRQKGFGGIVNQVQQTSVKSMKEDENDVNFNSLSSRFNS